MCPSRSRRMEVSSLRFIGCAGAHLSMLGLICRSLFVVGMFFQKFDQVFLMFVRARKRRSDAGIGSAKVGVIFAASLAAESARTFPGMSLCPGIQTRVRKMLFEEANFKILLAMALYLFVVDGDEFSDWIALSESVHITPRSNFEISICLRAKKIANSSAERTEKSGGSGRR